MTEQPTRRTAARGTRRGAHAAPAHGARKGRGTYASSGARGRASSAETTGQRRNVSRRRPPRRSPLPLIIACVLGLACVGLLAFFLLRSCGSGSKGRDDSAAVEQAPVEEAVVEEVDDGSVDINLMMVGDMLFHYQVRASGLAADGTRNYDHLFAHVLGELEDQDIKVLNQETPVAGPIYVGSAPDGYDGYPEFNGPQEVIDAEVKAGFNVVLKATNHAMDNASIFEDPYTLMRSERSYWKTNYPQVAVIGEADPDDPTSSVEDVYVFEKDGFRVALLNYTLDLNGNEGFDSRGLVSMLEEDHVRRTIASAHEVADMVVVFPHWGEEYTLYPVDMQYEWAQVFVDAGVDAIIGNHPHVIEPVVALDGPTGKKVPCYWSTGNFVSTSPSDEALVGGMAKLVLHKDADGTCSVTSAVFKPLISHLGLSDDMTTYMVYDWTDELAASNWLDTELNPSTDNTTLTPAWAAQFLTEVLGSGYDPATGVFTLDLSQNRGIPVTQEPQTDDAALVAMND